MKVSIKHIFGRQKSFARNGVFTTGKKRSKGKNSGTSITFVLVRSLLKRKDNELCCHRDSL